MRAFFILAFLIVCCFSTTISETVEEITLEVVRQQFLDYINDFRTDHGLGKLQLRYSYIAQAHATDQAKRDRYMAHSGFDKRADQIMDFLKQETDINHKSFNPTFETTRKNKKKQQKISLEKC